MLVTLPNGKKVYIKDRQNVKKILIDNQQDILIIYHEEKFPPVWPISKLDCVKITFKDYKTLCK